MRIHPDHVKFGPDCSGQCGDDRRDRVEVAELTTVDYDYRNWRLLDPKRTLVPLLLLKALTSAKSPSGMVIGRSRLSERVVPVKRKRTPTQPSGSLLPEEVAFE